MSEIKCPVCSSTDIRSANIVSSDPEYKYCLCNTCTLVFSSPMKQASSIWYEQSVIYCERHSLLNEKTPAEAVRKFVAVLSGKNRSQFNFSETLEWLTRTHKGRQKTILDIGCGDGTFMDMAHGKGFQVTGIDHDSRSINFIKKNLGLEAHCIDIKQFIESERKTYWVVTLFDVMEHLEDPNDIIEQINEVLQPGGWLVISVPTYQRWPRLFDPYVDSPPHHLSLWSRNSLQYLMQNKGFHPVFIKQSDFTLYHLLLHITWRISGIIHKRRAYTWNDLIFSIACLFTYIPMKLMKKTKGGSLLIISEKM